MQEDTIRGRELNRYLDGQFSDEQEPEDQSNASTEEEEHESTRP